MRLADRCELVSDTFFAQLALEDMLGALADLGQVLDVDLDVGLRPGLLVTLVLATAAELAWERSSPGGGGRCR